MAGWVKVHRDITKHYLWDDKPYSKGQAWLDLILMASHQDNKFLLGSQLTEVKRGGIITSELKLMSRWGWSKSKVRNFLKVLESDNMIVKKTDSKKTALNIVNYDIWQNQETTKEPVKNHAKTTERPVKDTNKNEKKVKNEKKNTYGAYGHVKLTQTEYDRLQDEFGIVEELIKYLDEYIEMKGKKYKNHNLVIRKWVVDAVKEKKAKESKQVSMYPDLTNYNKGVGEW